MKNVEENLNNYRYLIEDYIYKKLQKLKKRQDVFDVMEYCLRSGGKRVRPLLMVLVFEMLGGSNIDEILPFAAAVEFIHTYSLIHDDLPCMDNSDMRRGKLSCHKFFDEAAAVLAGDAFLTYAFEVVSENFVVFPEANISVINFLANSSGVFGMIGGQFIDVSLSFENFKNSIRKLIKMYRMKTGKLIEFSVMASSKIVSVNALDLNLLKKFSRLLGFAFQIKDDILDCDDSFEVIDNLKEQKACVPKITFVSLYGIEFSIRMLNKIFKKIVLLLNKFGERANTLIKFTEYLLEIKN
ncbi:MAG: polyprenyl synthetase family protein [Clostridiales bacterium]|jgi:geranylgeranyl diphosphate synthase type II|nr:polyprenyl synthetase family protein [Clostridiales bacterium]